MSKQSFVVFFIVKINGFTFPVAASPPTSALVSEKYIYAHALKLPTLGVAVQPPGPMLQRTRYQVGNQ